jgi:dGTPase
MAIDAPRGRAPYACDPRLSRGRAYPETEFPHRNVFRRDCDRIIHAAAFRRLKHKTQVFVVHEGDHYRTRLTHTLEVTQIARSLARALGLDEDLTEAIALGHDLGHPPFGHGGEQALDACMQGYGGFDHNVQTLRVVTELERRYAEFDGINLTWETLEGLAKHNGPLNESDAMSAYAQQLGFPLETYASAEAQAAAIADDIAYNAHDLDDGLRADLFAVEDFEGVPLLRDVAEELKSTYPSLEMPRRVAEIIRRLIARLIADVIKSSAQRLQDHRVMSVDGVRMAGHTLVAFSDPMTSADREIKAFLFPRMYRHPRIARITMEAQSVVRNLFALYTSDAKHMPPEWRGSLAHDDSTAVARRAADFIAGMTDRFALAEHARFFDSTPELR